MMWVTLNFNSGGYLNDESGNATPPRIMKPGLKNLRTARIM
jgi:hypothetical protein